MSRVQARGGVEGAGGSLRGLCGTERLRGFDVSQLEEFDRPAQIAVVHARAVEMGAWPQRSSPKALLARLRALEAALRTTYRLE